MADNNITDKQILNKIKDLLGPNTICVGFETLSIGATAVSLASIPAGATGCVFQVESALTTKAIRFREDGVAPTTTVGKFKFDGDEHEIIGAQSLQLLRLISISGTNQINVSYYK